MRYDFFCDECGAHGHINCSMSEIEEKEQHVVCYACGNLMRRIYNAPAVVYRGLGFTQAAHAQGGDE